MRCCSSAVRGKKPPAGVADGVKPMLRQRTASACAPTYTGNKWMHLSTEQHRFFNRLADQIALFFDLHASLWSSVASRLISPTLASAFDSGQSRLAASAIS